MQGEYDHSLEKNSRGGVLSGALCVPNPLNDYLIVLIPIGFLISYKYCKNIIFNRPIWMMKKTSMIRVIITL